MFVSPMNVNFNIVSLSLILFNSSGTSLFTGRRIILKRPCSVWQSTFALRVTPSLIPFINSKTGPTRQDIRGCFSSVIKTTSSSEINSLFLEIFRLWNYLNSVRYSFFHRFQNRFNKSVTYLK